MSYENLINDSPRLLTLARQVNEGGFVIPFTENGYVPQSYEILGLPGTDWAKQVDIVEADFAPDYDKVEYDNRALNIMGGYEVAMMLQNFGVDVRDKEILEKQPLKGKKVLDMGCGPGRITTILAMLGAEVDSFDATEEYVAITAKKLARASKMLGRNVNANLFVVPAEDYDFPEEKYDYVSAMFGVLNHIEIGFTPEFLIRINKSLKQGGKLSLSTYGSNDALVFDLINQEKLNYDPSILVRRVNGGIQLPDGIIPASFPYPEFISSSLKEAGFELGKRKGFLKFTSLYPKDPYEQNIANYLELVGSLNREAQAFLGQYAENADQLLMASFILDQKRSEQSEIDKFAYVGFNATKK